MSEQNQTQAAKTADRQIETQAEQARDYTIVTAKWFQRGKVGIVLVEADVPAQYRPQYRAYLGTSEETDNTAKKHEIVSSGNKLNYQEAKAFFPRIIRNQTQYVL